MSSNSFSTGLVNVLDPRIPCLDHALDPQQAQRQLQTAVPDLQNVETATLVRHKPGRRALIQYQLATSNGPLTVLGKIRAKGTDWKSYQVQTALWHQGFAADSLDGYSVPKPIGVVPDWPMWLQHHVSGVPATERLPTTDGRLLAERIAGLAHKLHRTSIPTLKSHTLEDELQILGDRLSQVSSDYPAWAPRLDWVLATCRDLATSISLSESEIGVTGIHRDFYGDQVIVGSDRLWLVDLDLYCQGSPALDIGNFIGHITEHSLRSTGNPNAMAEQETALREIFIANWLSTLSPNSQHDRQANLLRCHINLYAVLTLVRHIYISTRISSRRAFTEVILSVCETRLQRQL